MLKGLQLQTIHTKQNKRIKWLIISIIFLLLLPLILYLLVLTSMILQNDDTNAIGLFYFLVGYVRYQWLLPLLLSIFLLVEIACQLKRNVLTYISIGVFFLVIVVSLLYVWYFWYHLHWHYL
jgi:hypothetical protein